MDSSSPQDNLISAAERDGLYRTIFSRRDVRGQFKSDPIPDAVLSRILYAAHHAPSVGFMQPWNFIIVKSKKVRQRIHDLFSLAHQEAAAMFSDEKRDLYNGMKLEGIMESPVNICVTCDRQRTGPVVIGRTHISAMDLYSSVCAIQNLWPAAYRSRCHRADPYQRDGSLQQCLCDSKSLVGSALRGVGSRLGEYSR